MTQERKHYKAWVQTETERLNKRSELLDKEEAKLVEAAAAKKTPKRRKRDCVVCFNQLRICLGAL